jgi:hypothetical protein
MSTLRIKDLSRRALVILILAALAAGCSTQAQAVPDSPGVSRVPVTPAPSTLAVQPSPTFNPSPTLSPSPTPAPHLTALVPVASFWSPVTGISSAEVRTLLAGGKSGDFTSAVVQAGFGQAVVDRLGLAISTVSEMDPSALFAALRPGVLGLVRIDDLSPSVSALSLDGVSLFGASRLRDFSLWPLLVADPTSTFDYDSLWTIAGGGDVNLDRSVYLEAIAHQRGVDYPWAGGTSAITGHYCCGTGSNTLVNAQTTGSPGAFGAVFTGSDVSLVNLEGPAPNKFSYHPDGFSFSFDPALLAGLAHTGISAVGLANNHIRNAGDQGVLDTVANLDAVGVAHAGAGANLAAAQAPAWLSAGGQLIAFLAFDAIQSENWATTGRPGAAPLNMPTVVADIKAARAAGAGIVVVMPHWGTEYTAAISATQRAAAAAMVAAGADVILGSHPHWLSGVAQIAGADGRTAFIDYSLGDLIFDLNYDERTQEGAIVNLTFVGDRLISVKLIPTLLLDYSQGSVLTGAGASKVLADIERAS